MSNSEERKRIDGEVVRILKKLQVAGMFPGGDGSEAKAAATTAKRDTGKFYLFSGFCLSFAQWVYEVMEPDPNFIAGSCLLFFTICFGLLAVLKGFSLGKQRKGIAIFVFVMLFVGIDLSWHHQIVDRANASRLKQEALDRKDTARHLKAEMDYQQDDDPMRSEFSYVNGGDSPIVVTDICALSKAFNAAEEIYLPGNLCMYSLGESHHIRDGGDGQTEPFLERLFSGIRFVCADVTVSMTYHLESQSTEESKKFRFVSRWYPHGIRWVQQDVESPQNFCQDKLFQKPFGNMIRNGKSTWGTPPIPGQTLTPDITVTLPESGNGAAWTCGANKYGPYSANDPTALQQSINNAETCRFRADKSVLIRVPLGHYSSNGLTLPQTAGDTSTKFIVIQYF